MVSLESNSRMQQWEQEPWGREGKHSNGDMLWSFALELLYWQGELNMARISKRRKERERKGNEKEKEKRKKKKKKRKEFNWACWKFCCCSVPKVEINTHFTTLYISLTSRRKSAHRGCLHAMRTNPSSLRDNPSILLHLSDYVCFNFLPTVKTKHKAWK